MSSTVRFALPLLTAGQAQKELFHNEALTIIDALLNPCVEAVGLDTPPAAAEPGQMWIVGDAPTGAWQGAARQLALWTEGGWRIIAPRQGVTVMLRENGLPVAWRGESWQIGMINAAGVVIGGVPVVGPRRPAIANPSAGTNVDLAARLAISAILNTLRGHGLIEAS